ncbi:MAG: DUF3618 domain-containing protein [Alphaproteobacteria bacterium]|nr:DUF3618 domain-containing protein [Alphaproteobacteria bacterium]
MTPHSERLEQQADRTRTQLSATLEELRARMTPGQVIDSVLEYAKEGSTAEFLNNLGREIRQNPLPLVLISIGIAWLIVASTRSTQRITAGTASSAGQKKADATTAASAESVRTQQWRRERSGRVSDVTSGAADCTRDPGDAVADRVPEATSNPAGTAAAPVTAPGGTSGREEFRGESHE